jgi:hypothetical protein
MRLGHTCQSKHCHKQEAHHLHLLDSFVAVNRM